MQPTLDAYLRRHDPDRFLCSLFAPQDRRPALWALWSFNVELARARDAVSTPMLALVRLQWWREVVEGAAREHEVARPLSDALAAGALCRADLLGMIEGREVEADESIPTVDAWRDYLLATAGGAAVAAARLLGAPDPSLDQVRRLGAGYGAAGVLRSQAVLAARGRCLLPADLLARAGLTPEAAAAEPRAHALDGVRQALRAEAAALLAGGGHPRLPRTALPAVLTSVLARRDLRRGDASTPARPLGDRLAVTLAALRGRA